MFQQFAVTWWGGAPEGRSSTSPKTRSAAGRCHTSSTCDQTAHLMRSGGGAKRVYYFIIMSHSEHEVTQHTNKQSKYSVLNSFRGPVMTSENRRFSKGVLNWTSKDETDDLMTYRNVWVFIESCCCWGCDLDVGRVQVSRVSSWLRCVWTGADIWTMWFFAVRRRPNNRNVQNEADSRDKRRAASLSSLIQVALWTGDKLDPESNESVRQVESTCLTLPVWQTGRGR